MNGLTENPKMKNIWGLCGTIEQFSLSASDERLIKMKRVDNSALTIPM